MQSTEAVLNIHYWFKFWLLRVSPEIQRCLCGINFVTSFWCVLCSRPHFGPSWGTVIRKRNKRSGCVWEISLELRSNKTVCLNLIFPPMIVWYGIIYSSAQNQSPDTQSNHSAAIRGLHLMLPVYLESFESCFLQYESTPVTEPQEMVERWWVDLVLSGPDFQ